MESEIEPLTSSFDDGELVPIPKLPFDTKYDPVPTVKVFDTELLA